MIDFEHRLFQYLSYIILCYLLKLFNFLSRQSSRTCIIHNISMYLIYYVYSRNVPNICVRCYSLPRHHRYLQSAPIIFAQVGQLHATHYTYMEGVSKLCEQIAAIRSLESIKTFVEKTNKVLRCTIYHVYHVRFINTSKIILYCVRVK